MVDALVSGTSVRKDVEVQVLLSAPQRNDSIFRVIFFVLIHSNYMSGKLSETSGLTNVNGAGTNNQRSGQY
jgi:hypothetical protein